METTLIEQKNIKNMIYEVNNKQIIFDSDLARLYEVETKRINEAVKRNQNKFPERFCFRVSECEYENLKSQFATSNLEFNHGGSRKGHLAFTEQGIAMLATILKSKKAVDVSIRIMDTFVFMRKYITYKTNKINLIEDKLLMHDKMFIEYGDKLDELFDKLEPKLNNMIYYNGQIYEAYSKVLDILNTSKKEIIIIDSYADKKILDIVKDINRKVIIITKENNLLKKELIDKYNKQYNNLKVIYNNTFHDRFIIIDRKEIYHLGTSLNHLGEKTFGINIILEEVVIDSLINKIKLIV